MLRTQTASRRRRAFMLSMPRMCPASRGASNERKRTKTGSERPAASVDEQRVFRGDLVRPEKRERDHPTGRRRPGTARHLPDVSGSFRDLVAMDRRHVGVDSQAEQLAAHLADVRSAGHDLLPDVTPFREAQRVIRRDLEGERVFPYLHAEPRGAGFDPKDLERIAADWGHVPPREGVPDFPQTQSGGPDRVAEFPEPAYPADVSLVMFVDGKGQERVLRKCPCVHLQHAGDEIPRCGTVYLDVSAGAEVVELDIVADPGLLECRHHRVLLRRLDVED